MTDQEFVCIDDSQCGNGTCVSSVCVCKRNAEGLTCDKSWKDDEVWVAIIEAYGGIVVVLQLICVVFATYQLQITIRHAAAGQWKKKNLLTYVMIGCVAGSLIRVVHFAVDPLRIRDIIPQIAHTLLYNLPYPLWLSMTFMLQLYWVELQLETRMTQLHTIKKTRPVLMVFIVLCLGLLIPLVIWDAVAASVLSNLVYNAFFVVVAIVLITNSTIFGVKLIRILRSFKINRTVAAFMKKITFYLLTFNGVLVLLILVLVLFVLINAAAHKWLWVLFQLMIQVLEAVLVFITLLFCSKKKPKKLNADATETMESVTKDSTLDSIEIHESRNEHDEESEEELEEKRTNEDEEKKESEEKPENGGTEENH